MEENVAIKIEGVSKKFCRSLKMILFYGTTDVVRDMLGIRFDRARLRPKEFLSLDGINLEIRRGETFGLVGANGSGKTTLLRLMNGILPPDRGRITVKGRVGALIAVGAGFHPHMTGRENIYLNGTILGMTRREIDEQMTDIIGFADIGDFLDAPVSTYSSGMHVRLGFAIAIHSRPDIVLVDEILAVGDAKFQRKCLDKIREMRKSGTTFVLVTHNMQTVESMCDRALLLHNGKQLMVGQPSEIVPRYETLLQSGEFVDQDRNGSQPEAAEGCLGLVQQYAGFGTDEISVRSFCLTDLDGNRKNVFDSDGGLRLSVEIDSRIEVEKAILWSTFMYVNSKESDEGNLEGLGFRKTVSIPKGISTIEVELPRLGLATGEYKIPFDIFDDGFVNPYFQGHFGYFRVLKDVSTMLRVGLGSPVCWADPAVRVVKK